MTRLLKHLVSARSNFGSSRRFASSKINDRNSKISVAEEKQRSGNGADLHEQRPEKLRSQRLAAAEPSIAPVRAAPPAQRKIPRGRNDEERLTAAQLTWLLALVFATEP
jgi:hypothetical protein